MRNFDPRWLPVRILLVLFPWGSWASETGEFPKPAPPGDSACAQSEQSWLTLRLLAEHIRCHHPDVVQARAALQRQRALKAQAQAAFSPSVDLSVSGEGQRTGAFSGASWATSLSANYTIFDHGATNATVAAAGAHVSASEAGLFRSELVAVTEALEAMFNVLKAGDSLLALQANEEAVRKGLETAQARQAVGRGTRVDVLQAFSALKQAELETIRGRSEHALAAITLRQRLALQSGTDIQPRLDIAQWEPMLERLSFESTQPPARMSRSRQAHALWEATRQQSVNAEAQGRSNVTASATYRQGNRALAGSSRNDATMNVTWSIPLLDGGASKQAIKAAVFNEEKQHAAAESALREVEVDMDKSVVDWYTALATLDAARAAQAAAEETVEAQMGRYRAGAGTLIDWLEAQRDTLQAQRDRLDAGYKLMQAMVRRMLSHDDLRLLDLDAVLKEAS